MAKEVSLRTGQRDPILSGTQTEGSLRLRGQRHASTNTPEMYLPVTETLVRKLSTAGTSRNLTSVLAEFDSEAAEGVATFTEGRIVFCLLHRGSLAHDGAQCFRQGLNVRDRGKWCIRLKEKQ